MRKLLCTKYASSMNNFACCTLTVATVAAAQAETAEAKAEQWQRSRAVAYDFCSIVA